jgi:hypothetical protein
MTVPHGVSYICTLVLLLFILVTCILKGGGRQLKYPGVDHRIILKLILNEITLENIKWIVLTEGREQIYAFFFKRLPITVGRIA